MWGLNTASGIAAMSASPEAHNAVAALSPELDELAGEAMADWKVPGAASAVVQDGKVALVKSYGQRDVDAKPPVTPSTQFLIGSITKTFTAMRLTRSDFGWREKAGCLRNYRHKGRSWPRLLA
jgi:CubicO group peptidase (beta-lactamase class C family)